VVLPALLAGAHLIGIAGVPHAVTVSVGSIGIRNRPAVVAMVEHAVAVGVEMRDGHGTASVTFTVTPLGALTSP
jgi:hypothetical protein